MRFLTCKTWVMMVSHSLISCGAWASYCLILSLFTCKLAVTIPIALRLGLGKLIPLGLNRVDILNFHLLSSLEHSEHSLTFFVLIKNCIVKHLIYTDRKKPVCTFLVVIKNECLCNCHPDERNRALPGLWKPVCPSQIA